LVVQKGLVEFLFVVGQAKLVGTVNLGTVNFSEGISGEMSS
jgi:hypothetical protein